MKILSPNIKQKIFLVLFTITISCRLQAQAEKFQKEKYTVYIEDTDERIKAKVLAHKTKVKTKNDLTYYWYNTNKILETQGGYEGKLLHGEYVAFYQNNSNLKEKGNFKKGLKKGLWTNWYENGKIRSTSHWKNGQLCGRSKNFDGEGTLISEKQYKKDKETKLRKTPLALIKGLLKREKKEKKKPILAS